MGLVRTRDGVEIWTRSFTASSADAFRLQETIASRIEGELRSRFAGNAAHRADALVTDARAYGAYRSARSLLNRRGPGNARAARVLLEEALAADPGFAPAWALLSIAESLVLAQGTAATAELRRSAIVHRDHDVVPENDLDVTTRMGSHPRGRRRQRLGPFQTLVPGPSAGSAGLR